MAVILYTSLWNQLTTRQWSACLRDTIELNTLLTYPRRQKVCHTLKSSFEEPGELDVEVNYDPTNQPVVMMNCVMFYYQLHLSPPDSSKIVTLSICSKRLTLGRVLCGG